MSSTTFSMMTSTCRYHFVTKTTLSLLTCYERLLCQWWHVATTLTMIIICDTILSILTNATILSMITYRDYFVNDFISRVLCQCWHIGTTCKCWPVSTTLSMVTCDDYFVNDDAATFQWWRQPVFVNDNMPWLLCQWWDVETTLSMIACWNTFVINDIATTLSMACRDYVYGVMSQLFFQIWRQLLLILCKCWNVATTLSMITFHDYFVNDDMSPILFQWWRSHVATTL